MSNFLMELIAQQSDGTALANSTVATSLLAKPRRVVPSNFFSFIGQRAILKAKGRISNIVTTPGTLTLDLRFGAAIVWNGGAIPLNTTAKTNVAWALEVELVCRAIGATASLFGMGEFYSESVQGSAAGLANTCMVPASAPAVGATFDSESSPTVDLFGTWSIANAGNSIQVHQFSLDALVSP